MGDTLKERSLINSRSKLAAVAGIVLVAALLIAGGALSVFDVADTYDRQVELQLSWRDDLNAVAEAQWPLFLELNGTTTSGVAVRNIITIEGAGTAEVRTFPLNAPSVPWTPQEDAGGLTGAVPGADGGEMTWSSSDLEDGKESTLLMVVFERSGEYELSVDPQDGSGRSLGEAAIMSVTVSEGQSPLFGQPELGMWGQGWNNETTVGERLGFSLTAPTNDQWGDGWGTFYNWTITAICPSGMTVGGDLSKYNTGDTRVGAEELNATSVVTAWENGFNTAFYTVWREEGGALLSGDAAMTPNAKQLTQASGTYNEWITGKWSPFGAGTAMFNHAGHYLLVIALEDSEGRTSPPILLEAVVSPGAA